MQTGQEQVRPRFVEAFAKKGSPLRRLGYGAMQLAGPAVWGPPADPVNAVAVLRRAVALGVKHIDTSDYYGPHVVNHLIREALHPYADDLTIVTKVGARRTPDKRWPAALSEAELVSAVEDNLRHLGVEALDVVNLRVGTPRGPQQASLAEPFGVLVALQRQGLIRHLGLSNCTPEQVEECQAIAPIVCVQNFYNLANRGDDALIDRLAQQVVAYVPYYPLGGRNPLQSATLDAAARQLGATSAQVSLAWLLQRSPNILLIPGTSSLAHLSENMAASDLPMPPEVLATLDKVGQPA